MISLRWVIGGLVLILTFLYVRRTRDHAGILLAYLFIKLFIADNLIYSRIVGGIRIGLDHLALLIIVILKWRTIGRFAAWAVRRWPYRRILQAFAFLLLAAGISMVVGAVQGDAAKNLSAFQAFYFDGFFIFLLTGALLAPNPEKYVLRLFWGLLAFAFLMGAAQLYSQVTKQTWFYRMEIDESNLNSPTARFGGFLGNPNSLAAFFNIVIPFAILQIQKKAVSLRSLVSIVMIVLIAISYLFLASRGPLLALGVTILLLLAVVMRKNPRALIVVAVVAILIISLGRPIRSPALADRIDYYGSRFEAISDPVRLALWAKTLEAIVWHPLGIGLTNEDFMQNVVVVNPAGLQMADPHSMYLQIGISIGILGLLTFLFILVYISARLLKKAAISLPHAAVLFAIIAFALTGVTEPIFVNGTQLNNVFYVLIGSGFSLIAVSQKQPATKKRSVSLPTGCSVP